MRYSADHKEQTRARLIARASNLLRSNGVDGLGVAQVMASEGLTHGGFYAHFKSRNDLVAQAVGRAFEDMTAMLDRSAGEADARLALASYFRRYLSPRHRVAIETGCPVAALSSEAARLAGPARERFLKGVDTMQSRIGAMIEAAGAGTAAMAGPAVAQLVGALALSRMIEDAEEAEAFLDAVRDELFVRFGLERVDG